MKMTFIPPVPAEQLRSLPTRDIALLLLAHLSKATGFIAYSGTIGSARQAFQDEPDQTVLLDRLSDAWAWLEAHALLSKVSTQGDTFRRVSREGRELVENPLGLLRFDARQRLAGPLHSALEGTIRTYFDLGDYETACFAAMKAVEVAVRNAAGYDNSQLGVGLMRKAFTPHKNDKEGGPLADAGAEGGEQEAASALFAGAIGAYKNPASHRTVDFDDPIEAAEIIQLASLLLRQVDRAASRLAVGASE
ncbi:TIGR02391 family protein [Streptomyces hydrogenans]